VIPDPTVLGSAMTSDPLTPEGWFMSGHGVHDGVYNVEGQWVPSPSSTTVLLWAPAPAAASVAVDELSLSRFKRAHLLHVFVCPRLLTHMWRKKLFKVADLVLELPPGPCSVWPDHMHEPLLLALVLPFISFPPWQLRNTTPVLDMARSVRTLWDSLDQHVRVVLRQLCELPDTLAGMSPGVVRTMLHPTPAG
jgi:hypothetical protein